VTMRIRDYEAADLERCRALWRHLTGRHREIYGDPTIGGDDPGLELDDHLGHADLAGIWVAEEDGEIAGLYGLLVQGEEAEIEPIVVDPHKRGSGVGGQLARHALAEARRRGMAYLNVRPVARNVEAIHFFHREGFKILGRLELSMPLEGATPFSPARSTRLHDRTFDF